MDSGVIALFDCFISTGLAGNVKPFCLHLELKVGALVSVSDKTRFYSSSSGTTSVDFLDLT